MKFSMHGEGTLIKCCAKFDSDILRNNMYIGKFPMAAKV